jgi:hypothetical protein
MHLREHPLITSKGRRSWPPLWTSVLTTKSKTQIIPKGEAGTLKEIRHYRSQPGRVYLVIEFEGDDYIGCLLIDDQSFCKKLAERLRAHCGLSIQAIASLDLPRRF